MGRKARIREWLKDNFNQALEVRNDNYSKILLLSTIDCFAQAWGGFPKYNASENFCEFVLSHTEKRIELNNICPITLSYDYNLNKINLIRGCLYSYDDSRVISLANSIIADIPEKDREKARGKHSYVRLLYVMRNKLVHELNDPGTKIEFMEDKPTISSGIIDEKQV